MDMLTRTGLGGVHPSTRKAAALAALSAALAADAGSAAAWALVETRLAQVPASVRAEVEAAVRRARPAPADVPFPAFAAFDVGHAAAMPAHA